MDLFGRFFRDLGGPVTQNPQNNSRHNEYLSKKNQVIMINNCDPIEKYDI